MNKKTVVLSLLSVSIIALIFISSSFFVIYRDVKAACLKAQNEFNKDCLNSLVEHVKSDKHTIRERNSAIWALGQLADPKALPFLYELDKSLPEQKNCRYSDYMCKDEVKKAIRWCENGNVTNWMYRDRDKWR